MGKKLFVFFVSIFCFSFITVNAKSTTYHKDGNIVRIYNESFGGFDLGCPFNESCKDIIVTGNLNSEDLRALCLCSVQCETLDLANVKVRDDTVLPRWCFVDAYNLKTVNLPLGLKYIGECTFCNCVCLASVSLPDNLQEIGNGSFQGCPNLKMTVPSSVRVGENTFLGSLGVCFSKVTPSNNFSRYPRVLSSILSWVGL